MFYEKKVKDVEWKSETDEEEKKNNPAKDEVERQKKKY